MNLEQETKFILNKYNAHANKNYGQNFLINQSIINGILEKNAENIFLIVINILVINEALVPYLNIFI